ncbi:MAG: hypothetical protein WBC74_04060 [Candidatus Omnitrophota bacterium]
MYKVRCEDCGFIGYSACETPKCKCGSECRIMSDENENEDEED